MAWLHRTDALKRIPWRPMVLIALGIIVAAFSIYSLIVDPPDTAPPPLSYLPQN